MNIKKHEPNQNFLTRLNKHQRKEYDKYAQYAENVRDALINEDYTEAQQRAVPIGRYVWSFSDDDVFDAALYSLFDDYACQIAREMLTLKGRDDLSTLGKTVRNLMGTSPQFASAAQFDAETIEGIASQIVSRRYENYPFVIVARYVPIAMRERFARLVMHYGHAEHRMSWAMAHEACITLSYLRVLPEASVEFLAEKLNAGGCDDMPYEGAMDALLYFPEYIDGALDAFVEQFDEISSDGNLRQDYFRRLSKCISTKAQAEKLLPAFCKAFIEYYNEEPMDFSYQAYQGDAPELTVLAFYGQLQVLINYPHCVLAK